LDLQKQTRSLSRVVLIKWLRLQNDCRESRSWCLEFRKRIPCSHRFHTFDCDEWFIIYFCLFIYAF